MGFWYTQGFLDSGFSLFAYSKDESRTDVIQMVKEYGGIEYEINLSEKRLVLCCGKNKRVINAYLFQKSLTEQIVDAFPVLKENLYSLPKAVKKWF